ncbi:MAG: hypothetical protein IJE16_00230 [Ruminococcus sp.]|nr:hypothetical protein [Ruminococcus sp.]
MLSFAVFGHELIKVTKENDESIVNNVLGCVYKPLNIKQKNGEYFQLNKGTCSKLLNCKCEITKEIQRGAATEIVISNAEKYFSDHVVHLFIPSLIEDFLENMRTHILCDTTISEIKKEELLLLANKNHLAKFVSSVFLYVINKPNTKKYIHHVKNNLPQKNEYFSGRIDQLQTIEEIFTNDKIDSVSISQTISGLGGIGKTQLSIEYAYRYMYKYSSCVWFVNAENDESTYNYFLDFAKCFKLPLPKEYTTQDLKRVVNKWFGENQNWLLILDNIENIDTINGYLPESIKGNILLTTRNKRISFGKPFSLDVFSEKEAIAFLKRRLSDDNQLKLEHYYYEDFEENCSKLVSRLGSLPLALEQAAAYIREVRCSLEKYLSLLAQSGVEAFQDSYATPKYYEHIVTNTWLISFKALDESSQQLMNLCAYMAPDRIPISFFVKSKDKLPMPLKRDLSEILTTNRIVTSLRTYSLVSGTSEFINIHRLVQEVVRNSHKL